MKKHLFLSLLFLLLAGCSQDKSGYDYYVMHPDATKAAYERCAILPPSVVQTSTQCRQVIRAAITLQTMTRTAAYSQLKFGLQLMAIESQLVSAKTELTDLLKSADQEKVKQQQVKVSQLEQQRSLYLMVICLVRPGLCRG